MMVESIEIIHANVCKLYLDGEIVGGLQEVNISIKYDNYFYKYIGGSEVRVGSPSIEGNYRFGVLDFDRITTMFKKTFDRNASVTNVSLVDGLSFHQDKLNLQTVTTIGFDDGGEVNIYKILLRGITFNRMNYDIRASSFVLGSGEFYCDNIKYTKEQKEITITQ